MEFHNEESVMLDGAVVSSGHSTATFLSRKVLESNPEPLHFNNAPGHKFKKIFSARTMKKNLKDNKPIFTKKGSDLSNTQLSDDLKKAHDQIKVLKKINENLIKENKALKTKNRQQNMETLNSNTFSIEQINNAITDLNIPSLVENKLLQQKQNQRHGNSEMINMQICQNVASSIPKSIASSTTFPALEPPSSDNFHSLQVTNNYLALPPNPDIAAFGDLFGS